MSTTDSNFCSKCGKLINEEKPTQTRKNRSNWWYLLPILLHIIGGIISYYAVRKDDPKLAKNCIKVGLVFLGLQFLIGLFSGFSGL